MNSTRECFAGVESEPKKQCKKQSDTKRLIIESSQKQINAMPPIEVPANKNYADFDTHLNTSALFTNLINVKCYKQRLRHKCHDHMGASNVTWDCLNWHHSSVSKCHCINWSTRSRWVGLVASKIIIDTICRNNSKRIGSKVNWSHATSRWSGVCDCEECPRGGGGLQERGEQVRLRISELRLGRCLHQILYLDNFMV